MADNQSLLEVINISHTVVFILMVIATVVNVIEFIWSRREIKKSRQIVTELIEDMKNDYERQLEEKVLVNTTPSVDQNPKVEEQKVTQKVSTNIFTLLIELPVVADGILSEEDQKGLEDYVIRGVKSFIDDRLTDGVRICEFARYGFNESTVSVKSTDI